MTSPLHCLRRLRAAADPQAARDLDVAALPERAPVAWMPLYESRPGAYAAAQGAAVGERVDTDAHRRLNSRRDTARPPGPRSA